MVNTTAQYIGKMCNSLFILLAAGIVNYVQQLTNKL